MTEENKTEEIPPSVLEMQKMAEADVKYQKRCIFGEKVFFVEADKAYVEGHIYSPAGDAEFFISSCCEFHFDKMFAEPNESEEGDEENEDTPNDGS